MALRVLLADESSTIKKVMQLALSDYGVEVKSVPVGLDVLQVSKNFKPDIVFADVLLTKRSGYEVCADLKNDSQTAHIPVVLMWSGFMEIDELKAQECQADRRLEKPFDADLLRSIVSDLVKKTESNPISNFVTFPEMPEFDESPMAKEDSVSKIPTIPDSHNLDSIPLDPDMDNFSVDSIESTDSENYFANIPEIDENAAFLGNNEEEFSSVPLTANPKSFDEEEVDEGGWSHQDLTKFKIQVPLESEETHFAEKFVIPSNETLDDSAIPMDEVYEEVPTAQQQVRTNAQGKSNSKMDIGSDLVEKVIREEAREIIEAICWKILPDIAERVVRDEIKKILRETEKSI